jgi:hypothetical protein
MGPLSGNQGAAFGSPCLPSAAERAAALLASVPSGRAPEGHYPYRPARNGAWAKAAQRDAAAVFSVPENDRSSSSAYAQWFEGNGCASVRLFARISGGKRHPPSASIALEVHRVVAD